MTATYRSPFYPSIQIMLDGDRSVKFVGGRAEVADELVPDFEDYIAGPYGREYQIVRDDGLVGKATSEGDPADDLGPGYTPVEREAYRRARSQTAPPPDGDQRTDGVKTAVSIPVFPPGVDPTATAPVDPAQAALDSADAAAAERERQLAEEREAAVPHEPGQDIRTADTEGAPVVVADADANYSDMNLTQLKDLLRSRGLKTSGNKDELIARLNEAG